MEGTQPTCCDHSHKEGEEHKHETKSEEAQKKQTLCVAQLQFETFE